ncbi:hypothetical protein NMY22_g12717 [Coprinellus aureogranulatus]|nr:hypothetical protein NMY22_g12717 [Coprinellus aureogranulatus]
MPPSLANAEPSPPASAAEGNSPSASTSKPKSPGRHQTFDIEHVPVEDDPRKWSPLRKVHSHSTSSFA